MTPERLRTLIAAGETLAVEFKGEEHGALPDRDLVQTVVCLANRPGDASGWLLIGVEDDGRVTGARPRHEGGHTDPYRVQALIANRTRPALSVRVEVMGLDGRDVLVIEVPTARLPIGTTDGQYLRRAIGGRGHPECVPFHFHEMLAHQADRGILDYSALTVFGAHWDDLDPLEFARFRRSIRESGGLGDTTLLDLPEHELAKALGAVEANHTVTGVRVLALLLFGKEESLRRLLPTHEVAFQVLTHTRVEVNDFFRWPLLRVMDELLGRWRARNREDELMIGMGRVGIPDYSGRAFREGVANALVHRDYTRLGTVHVQWHPDRIDISSPGGFPHGVRLDNLLVTPPQPRNPLLADAFKRAGIVERTARGIDTLFYEQLRYGRPAPSYDRSSETTVTLVLPGGKVDVDFVRLLVEESQAGHPLGLDDLLVLHALRQEGRLSVPEAARCLQKTEAEAQMVLERLIDASWVAGRGAQRGRTYLFSATTAQRLGEPPVALQDRATSAQWEQRVLHHVATHGRITRRETAVLCRITSLQARTVLNRLVRQGELVRQGAKRGVFYILASKSMD
jgi:ATP-dependent DNA helicase RecG